MSIPDSSTTAHALWQENPERWLRTHESGVLSLSVGPDGQLATFRLDRQWYRTLNVDEFGAAVLQTEQESSALRVRELEETLAHGVPAADQVDASEDSGVVNDTTNGSDEEWARLTSRMHNLSDAFDQLSLYSQAVMSATQEEDTLTSASGRLTMTLRGGRPRSLTLDSYGVEMVPEAELASELIDLFRRADSWLKNRRDDVLDDLPELAAIYRARR